MGDFDKEPIATVTYEWSKDYYSQYMGTVYSRIIANKTVYRLILLWNYGISLILILEGILIGDISNIIIGLFLCGITIWMGSYTLSAIFKSYKRLQGVPQRIDFYNSYFTVTDQYNCDTLPYEVLYAIKSSKYGYVLCDSIISGIFVPKGECSPQLISFIEEVKRRLSSQKM